MRNKISKLSVALSKAQGEMNKFVADKDGYNFKYLTLSKIYEVVLPILSKNGLSISSSPSTFARDGMPFVKVDTYLYFEDEFLMNSLSFPLIDMMKKTDTQIMMLGSTISYITRYNVQALLSIAGTDKDVETINAELQEAN